MQLRPYQQTSVTRMIAAVDAGQNPCVVLPGAAGKSVVVAEICRILVEERNKRVLMLVDRKELIQQNANKLREVYQHHVGHRAPLGIFSASLKRKQAGFKITYGGIHSVAASIRKHGPGALGEFDFCLIDEAHGIPTKGQGMYRSTLEDLRSLRPMQTLGLTATPWRLGHGSIADGEGALFDHLIDDVVSVRELVEQGYTAPLFSKQTDVKLLDLVGEVKKRGGEYVESELAAAVNLAEPNEAISAEIILRGQEKDRRHCLVFCVSVAHAKEMARIITSLGKKCGVIHGAMSDLERDDALTRFRCGEWWGLCNVDILTTGYDFPDLDMIALCRPTMSPTLYMQIVFRGMRLKVGGTTPHQNCYVLDFAGLIGEHGPITDVRPPRPPGEKKGSGGAIVKPCPKCAELVLISCMVCTDCGYEWEAVAKKPVLHTDDIMGERRQDGVAGVTSWFWWAHTAKSGKRTLACEYTLDQPTEPLTGTDESAKKVRVATEYLTVWAEGDPGKWAREKVERYAAKSGVELIGETKELIERLNAGAPPQTVKLTLKGGYVRVGWHKWVAKSEVRQAAE
jgi:DNA repair protein RadD